MIVITRPVDEAELTVARLRARGIDAEARPLIVRAPLPVAWPERTDVLFLTSRYAAELARVTATTVAALKRSRPSATITADAGAVALAKAVQASGVRGAILYPTSTAAKLEPEHHEAAAILQTCGALTVLEVYETRPVDDARATIAAAAHDATWSFYSPSAVRAFVAHAEHAPARVVCHGGSTLRAWRELKQSTWPDADLEELA